jgi:hypothetical protein
MEGNPDILKDNRAAVTGAVQFLVDQPAEAAPVRTDAAQDLLPIVLADVGATLPTRDPVYLRIIEEVKSGKTKHGN